MEFSRWGDGEGQGGVEEKEKYNWNILHENFFSKKNKKETGYNHFYVPLFGLLQEDVPDIYKYLNFLSLLP